VYPAVPSVEVILLQPSKVPRAKGGIVVCIRTLIASQGHKRISAKNSAEAEAARYNVVRYLWAFSSPAKSAYFFLKTSYKPYFPAPTISAVRDRGLRKSNWMYYNGKGTGTLEGVSDECRTPTGEVSSQSFRTVNL